MGKCDSGDPFDPSFLANGMIIHPVSGHELQPTVGTIKYRRRGDENFKGTIVDAYCFFCPTCKKAYLSADQIDGVELRAGARAGVYELVIGFMTETQMNVLIAPWINV